MGPAPGDGRYRTMLGYWGRPEATAEALAGGVLHTGDLGEVGDDGYLRIRDRKSLLILRGGANVYPAEVERVLLEAPGVAACAVLGVPDERLGERVVAVVEADGPLDEEAVRAALPGGAGPLQGPGAVRGRGGPAAQRHGQGHPGRAPWSNLTVVSFSARGRDRDRRQVPAGRRTGPGCGPSATPGCRTSSPPRASTG